jgi:hypothetical protein
MRTIKLDQSCMDAQGRVKGPLVGHDLPDESHEASSACWCKPLARTYGGTTVYEHAQDE